MATIRHIYVASSWRNPHQPDGVADLHHAGHDVYDFKNPPGNTEFGWKELRDDGSTDAFLTALAHQRAVAGFQADFTAMNDATAFVLSLPCGKSAHHEAGWAIGRGIPTSILLPPTGIDGWELMYLLADAICRTTAEVVTWLESLHPGRHDPPPPSNAADAARRGAHRDGLPGRCRHPRRPRPGHRLTPPRHMARSRVPMTAAPPRTSGPVRLPDLARCDGCGQMDRHIVASVGA